MHQKLEYFYTPPDLIDGDELLIDGDELSHLTHVMRKRIGDEVMVVDGVGHAYRATIQDLSRRKARCSIEDELTPAREPEIILDLAAGVLKNSSRFDVLVEKATELGVHSVTPLRTERTIPQKAKTARWQKLALAAMKQSGRAFLPKIHELTGFDEFLEAVPEKAVRIMPFEKSTAGIGGYLEVEPCSQVVICIGPEGGFSDEEAESALHSGFRHVSLGPRRLRTETAAMVSTALVLLGKT